MLRANKYRGVSSNFFCIIPHILYRQLTGADKGSLERRFKCINVSRFALQILFHFS